ncbi:hypothetical protein RHODGE_RHODGE_00394 [Rhodoplanes serenus]|uniref:Uncharacterized protein n=1 Tax=Rhodoplanes serenus TaxID=200615 RepID=A0A3S4F745_9BRAD|nr:hypothetical protein [Rhodoplanes serenus]MBI5114013.1 hypothetical protein [Rhodovulum sp.]VCU07090.1 hypothetical protein RHODGE_RHODGE_00394 [Rhodoplanes serenus]
MAELFVSGRVIDLILILVVIEAVGLAVLARLTRRVPRIGTLLPNLAAGACLLLAVRAALAGAAWPWVAAALLAALVAHLADLGTRLRAPHGLRES